MGLKVRDHSVNKELGVIHYRNEGENFRWGLNIDVPTLFTRWAFTLILPLPFISFEDYDSLLTGDRVGGLRVLALMLRLRRRRVFNQSLLFRYRWILRPIGPVETIYTREEWQDGLHHGDVKKSKAIKGGLAASVRGLG